MARRGLRRGFSLVETVAVFALIAILGTLAAISLSDSTDQLAADVAVRANLDGALDATVEAAALTGSPVAELATVEVYAPRVSFTAGVSDRPDLVSYAVANAAAGLAAQGADGTCWLIRRDFAATGLVTVYAYSTTAPCTAASALGLPTAGPRGGSWADPVSY